MIRILAAAMPGGWCGVYGGGRKHKLSQRKKQIQQNFYLFTKTYNFS